MKKTLLNLTMLVLAIIAGLTTTKAESSVSEMKAQVDGAEWTAYLEDTKYTPTVTAYVTMDKNKKYAVDVTATREVYNGTTLTKKEKISFNVKILGPGTYTLAGYNAAGYGEFYRSDENSSTKNYLAMLTNDNNTGTLTITEFDLNNLKIAGTFSFKGYHKDYKTGKESRVAISNGSFSTNHVSVSNSKIASNEFTASVNGVAYAPYTESKYKDPATARLKVDKSNPSKIKYSLDIYTSKEIYEGTTLVKTETVVVNAKITGTGTYLLGGYNAPGYGQYTIKNEKEKSSYETMQTNQENTGTLIITEFDPTNMKIVGTFTFKGYHKDYKTAKESRASVTDGKFTINAMTYSSY